MPTTDPNQIIQALDLMPHPEGGYFAETYRSEGVIPSTADLVSEERNVSTAIYYLLRSKDISRFHRIRSDEVWHHYMGVAVTIHIIHDDGLYEAKYVGKSLEDGEKPQCVIPAGSWFGATVDKENSFALCGCTVAPGFDFDDFEMADRYRMLQAFPEHEAIIEKLLPLDS